MLVVTKTFFMFILCTSANAGIFQFVEDNTAIQLTCQDTRRDKFPVIFVLKLSNGRNKEYANFTQDSCEPLQNQVKCFNNIHNYTIQIPLNQRAMNVTGFFCFKNEKYAVKIDAVKNATCIGPVVNEESNQISISCKVEKVLTNLVCLFYDHQNQLLDAKSTTYTSREIVNETSYTAGECKHTESITKAGVGEHKFYVLLYPNIKKGESYGEKVYLQDSMVYSIPKATIDGSCPEGGDVKDGFIKREGTFSCLCKRADNGSIGYVNWFDMNGKEIAEKGKNQSVLFIKNIRDQGQSYVCKGVSVFGTQEIGELFRPQLAYGPGSVFVNTSGINNGNKMCTTQLTCSVDSQSAFPGVEFTLHVNGEVQNKTKQNYTDGTDYMAKIRIINNCQPFVFICKASNLIFNETSDSATLNLEQPLMELDKDDMKETYLIFGICSPLSAIILIPICIFLYIYVDRNKAQIITNSSDISLRTESSYENNALELKDCQTVMVKDAVVDASPFNHSPCLSSVGVSSDIDTFYNSVRNPSEYEIDIGNEDNSSSNAQAEHDFQIYLTAN